MANVRPGLAVRPNGCIDIGTITCVASDAVGMYLVTCDHVVKLFGAPVSDGGPWGLFPPPTDPSPSSLLASFQGRSLCNSACQTADVAASPLYIAADGAAVLPQALPGTGVQYLTGIRDPIEGLPVFIWGATTRCYISATISTLNTKSPLVHAKYGAIIVHDQFALTIDPAAAIPAPGDSGGPVLTAAGFLVGNLISERTNPESDGTHTAYACPIGSSLQKLNLQLVVGP